MSVAPIELADCSAWVATYGGSASTDLSDPAVVSRLRTLVAATAGSSGAAAAAMTAPVDALLLALRQISDGRDLREGHVVWHACQHEGCHRSYRLLAGEPAAGCRLHRGAP